MHNAHWIHKVAKVNDIMYPDTKLFLNILIWHNRVW